MRVVTTWHALRTSLAVLIVCASGVVRAQSQKPLLLRDPSLSKTHIAFAYAGNIWVADRDGSNPRRLTSGGHEARPALSPDGSQIAFVGEYDGPRNIYVVPVTGGEPRRLTYHPADLGDIYNGMTGDVVGWTPDGNRVLFSSRRAAFANGVIQLFTVPIEGGFATQVPLARAAQGSLAPDAARIAYVANVQWEHEWKRYRGGQTTSIWIADLSDSSIQATIPRDNSNDFNPMWVGGHVYFLSDRNGPVTLFSYDLESRQVKQIVRNEGLDIKSAGASSDAIAYEQFGSLHLLDLKSGTDRILDIHPMADFPEVRPHFENVSTIAEGSAQLWKQRIEPKISPNGARAAFGVRGEILTVPAKIGDIRNLTRTPDVVERDPAWSPDGQSIAYFSDESGEYALHVRDQSGLGSVKKIDLGKPPSFYYSPKWSPDSKNIGYSDKRLNFWYVDLEHKKPVRVDTDLYAYTTIGLQWSWSADSRWIAYTKQLRSHFRAVFIYSIEQAKSYQLTDGMSDALDVAFDKAGEYLYFTASTDVGLQTGWLDMSSLHRPVTRGVYAIVLKKTLSTPLLVQSDEERAQGTAKSYRAESAQTKIPPVGIDLDGIRQRIVCLPIPARNYDGLFAGKPGVFFLVEAPPAEDRLSFILGESAKKIHKFDMSTRKAEIILEDVTYFDVSFTGEKLLYGKHNQADEQRWFITSAEKPADRSSQTSQSGALNLESMKVYVDPRPEWKHLYEQVWRNERDFFYDPGLHGLNLADVRKKYEPFLDNISSRDDLYYLFAEMLANMTVGHMDVLSPYLFARKSNRVGLLGADYSVDSGRYRFAHIYNGDTWNPEARSPLREAGANVRVGEYLLAVNGRGVRPPVDVYSYFQEMAGQHVVLTIGPAADGSGSREVTIVPVDDEAALRHFEWVEDNRRKVDELTGGRVAYVYIPDTETDGYASFNRYFFAQVGKDAAIIDERYNGGGLMADYIIDHLRRPLLGYFHMRDGGDITTPMEGIFGPKVMLINEMAGSCGDALPWMFRKSGIGPLIGKRTWGGLVGYYTNPDDLLDGGHVATPNLAFYSPSGAWEIENHGVQPDIEVQEDPKVVRTGHDPQLDMAVQVVLDLLEKTPPPIAPQHPAYPNYQKSEQR